MAYVDHMSNVQSPEALYVGPEPRSIIPKCMPWYPMVENPERYGITAQQIQCPAPAKKSQPKIPAWPVCRGWRKLPKPSKHSVLNVPLKGLIKPSSCWWKRYSEWFNWANTGQPWWANQQPECRIHEAVLHVAKRRANQVLCRQPTFSTSPALVLAAKDWIF